MLIELGGDHGLQEGKRASRTFAKSSDRYVDRIRFQTNVHSKLKLGDAMLLILREDVFETETRRIRKVVNSVARVFIAGCLGFAWRHAMLKVKAR